MTAPKTYRAWIVCALLCVTNGVSVNAASITWDVVLTIDTSGVDEISVGDAYLISFSYDDAAVDENTTTFGGRFPDALPSYSIARDPSNTGTWDPASGTPDLSQDNFVTNANGDNMTIQMRGTGFPSASPGAFFDVGVSFGFSVDIVDSGSGQTLSEILGDAFLLDNIVFTVGEIRFEDLVSFSGSLDLDSDDDGVPNALDACPGFDDSIDANSNGVPDGCDIICDLDLDGDVDHTDHAIFVSCITGPVNKNVLSTLCVVADIDVDDDVDLFDLADCQALFAGSEQGDPSKTTVTGVVQLSDGTPIVGADVELAADGQTTTSGNEGRFFFSMYPCRWVKSA